MDDYAGVYNVKGWTDAQKKLVIFSDNYYRSFTKIIYQRPIGDLIGDRHAASEVSYRTPMRHMSVSKSSPMLQQLILRKADDYEEVYNVKGWTDALKKLVFSLCYL